MGLKEYDYDPSQLLSAASVEPREGCSAVSIAQALDKLFSLSRIGPEFEGGCTGLDALCYHLDGGTVQKAIVALNKVLKHFEELDT